MIRHHINWQKNATEVSETKVAMPEAVMVEERSCRLDSKNTFTSSSRLDAPKQCFL